MQIYHYAIFFETFPGTRGAESFISSEYNSTKLVRLAITFVRTRVDIPILNTRQSMVSKSNSMHTNIVMRNEIAKEVFDRSEITTRMYFLKQIW